MSEYPRTMTSEAIPAGYIGIRDANSNLIFYRIADGRLIRVDAETQRRFMDDLTTEVELNKGTITIKATYRTADQCQDGEVTG